MAKELFKDAWNHVDKVSMANTFDDNKSEHDKISHEDAIKHLENAVEDGTLKEFLISFKKHDNDKPNK